MIVANKRRLLYDVISNDITSNCNIRCKFCFNRWEEIPPNVNMTCETFQKVKDLLPLAQDEGFYFSCLYEPLMNKNICDLLACIPAEYRNKCFFTTNLAVRLSDEVIRFLSTSNLHHINISMESLNADTYNELCEHAKFEVYFDNLKRITEAFKKAVNPPKLRYVTMILRQNYDEIPEIAARCHKEFLSVQNEFRTPFVGPHMNLKWMDNQILGRDELESLSNELASLSIPIFCSTDTCKENYQSIIDEKADLEAVSADTGGGAGNSLETNSRYYHLRIDSDGKGIIYGTGETFDIHEIEHPYDFFCDKLRSLHESHAQHFIYHGKIKRTLSAEEGLATVVVDNFTDTEGFIKLDGWAALNNMDMNQYEKLILIESGNRKRIYLARNINRPDVVHAYNNEGFRMSGFSTLFKKDEIGSEFTLSVIFKPKNHKKWYRKKYEEILGVE